MSRNIKAMGVNPEDQEHFEKYMEAKSGHVFGCDCARCKQINKKFKINITED